jgi:hypothetical protein
VIPDRRNIQRAAVLAQHYRRRAKLKRTTQGGQALARVPSSDRYHPTEACRNYCAIITPLGLMFSQLALSPGTEMPGLFYGLALSPRLTSFNKRRIAVVMRSSYTQSRFGGTTQRGEADRGPRERPSPRERTRVGSSPYCAATKGFDCAPEERARRYNERRADAPIFRE